MTMLIAFADTAFAAKAGRSPVHSAISFAINAGLMRERPRCSITGVRPAVDITDDEPSSQVFGAKSSFPG
jgi:hypothetical protein